MQRKLTADDLRTVGFERIGCWLQKDDGLELLIDESKAEQVHTLLAVANALYSFCRGDEVLYIGKTARTLKKRLAGYRRPVRSQSTNLRCNKNIRKLLATGDSVAVMAFVPITQLQFSGFDINLAAALEDALVRRFSPPWNGLGTSKAVTESAEVEAEQEGVGDDSPDPGIDERERAALGTFTVRLGPTYYEKGIVNPGVEASTKLGGDGETLVVEFSDGAPSVATRIDRHANSTGAVRFVGGNAAIADWFHTKSG